jgi:hypothetical protein
MDRQSYFLMNTKWLLVAQLAFIFLISCGASNEDPYTGLYIGSVSGTDTLTVTFDDKATITLRREVAQSEVIENYSLIDATQEEFSTAGHSISGQFRLRESPTLIGSRYIGCHKVILYDLVLIDGDIKTLLTNHYPPCR